MQSKVTTNLIHGFRLSLLLMLLISIYCAQRWQCTFYKMLDRLLKMEKITVQPNFYSEGAKHNNLMTFLLMRILIFLIRPRLIRFFKKYFLWHIKSSQFHICVVDMPSFLQITLTTTLLNQILVDPMPMPEQFRKIVRLQRMFIRLILMINKMCILFKYPVMNSIVLAFGQCCLCGYLIAPICLGSVNTYTSTTLIINIIIFTVGDLLDFLFLASVGEAAGKLPEKAFLILCNPSTNVNLTERIVSNSVCKDNIGLLS